MKISEMTYNQLRAAAKSMGINVGRNPKKEILLDLVSLYSEADELNVTVYPNMEVEEVREAITEHKKVIAAKPVEVVKKKRTKKSKAVLVPIITLSKGAKLKTSSGKYEWTITEKVDRDGKTIRILMIDELGRPWNCTSVKDLAKNVIAI